MRRLFALLLILFSYFHVVAQNCPLPDGGFTKTDITCFGNVDGTITASVSVDDPSTVSFVLYDINKGEPFIFYNGAGQPTRALSNGGRTVTFGSVHKGNYWIVVYSTDLAGCPSPALIIGGLGISILEPAQISISYTSAPDCNNLGSGSVDLTITGGTAPYSFNWTGPTAIGNIEDPAILTSGTYSVIVTDANNCTSSLDNIVVEPGQAVFAGNDSSFCENSNYTASSAWANSHDAVLWTSSGDGVFVDNTVLNAAYSPGPLDIAAGNVNLTITGQKTGCPDVSDAIDLTLIKGPLVDAGSDEEVCAGILLDLSLSPIPPAALEYSSLQWTSSGDGIFNNPAVLMPVYAPGAGDMANGSVTLTLQANGNGTCAAVSDNMTLTITPAPIVDAGTNGAVCMGDVYDLSASSPAVSNYSSLAWATVGDGAFDDSSILEPVYTPGPNDVLNGSVILTLQAAGTGSCAAATDNMTLTLLPPPTVDAGDNKEVCSGSSFDLGSSGTTVTATNYSSVQWSTSGDGTFSDASILMPVYTPGANDRIAGSVVLTLQANGNATCAAVTDAMTLTITVAPTAYAGTDGAICQTEIYDLAASIPSASDYSSLQWSTAGDGSFDNTALLTPVYTPGPGDILNGGIILTLQANGNGSCEAAVDHLDLSILFSPVANAGNDQAVCAGSTLDFGVLGVLPSAENHSSLQWTTGGDGSFNDASLLSPVYTPGVNDILAGSVVLTLQANGNGSCGIATDNMVLTFTPPPVANAGEDQAVCAGSSLDFSVLGVLPSAENYSSLQWTASGDGSFNDPSVLTPVYTPGANDILAGSVTLTLQANGNGSCAATTDNMTLSITPAPVANAGEDQAVCAGSALDFSALGVLPSAANYSSVLWSASGDGTFNNASSLTPVYTPGLNDILAGSVILTLQANGNGSCGAVTDNMTLTITPSPTANAGDDQAVCAGSSLDFSVLGVLPIAANYSGLQWTSSGDGSFNDPTLLTPVYTPGANDNLAGSVVLILQANGNGSCGATTDNMLLTLTPAPVANAGEDQAVCAGSTLDFSVLGVLPIAANYSGLQWTSSGDGSFNDPTLLTPVYTPGANDNLTGSIVLTLQANGNGSCGAVTDNMTLTITPSPTANAGDDQAVCAGSALDFSALGVLPSAANYSSVLWSASGDGTFDNASSLTPVYTPGLNDILAGSVILTLQANGNGSCGAVTDNMTLTITPSPTANAGDDQAVCAGSALDFSALGVLPSAANYSSVLWSASGDGTFDNASSLTPVYTPGINDILASSVILTLQANGNGSCGAVTDNMTLAITPSPTANAGDDQAVCAGSALDFSALGVLPSAANYSSVLWSASGDGTFDNASSLTPVYTPGLNDILAGSVILTLQVNGNGSCGAVTDNVTLAITPAPTANAGDDQAVCPGSSLDFSALGVLPSAANYSSLQWSTSGDGSFNDVSSITPNYTPGLNDLSNGSVVLTLQANGNGGCAHVADAMTLTINSVPQIFNIAVSNNGEFCDGGAGVSIGLAGSENNVRYRLYRIGVIDEVASVNGNGSEITFGLFDLPGNYFVVAESLLSSCSINLNDTVSIVENPLPDAPTGATNQQYCAGDAIPALSVDAAAAGYRIDWFDQPTGGTQLTSGTNIYSPAAAGNYYAATVNETTGCASARVGVSAIENAKPATPVISGNINPDCNSIENYSVADHAGSTYDWFVSENSGYTITAGQGTSVISASIGSFNGWIGVVETASGCESDTAIINLNLTCFNAGYTAAPKIICSGETVAFDPSISSGTTDQTIYNWDFGSAGQLNDAGPGIQTIVFTNPGDDMDTVFVSLHISDPGNSVYRDTVFVRPLPAKPVITDVDPVCSNQGTIQLQADIPGGQWSGPGIIDPVAGIFDPSIVDPGQPFSQAAYTVTNGVCANADMIDIEVYPLSAVTFRVGDYQTQGPEIVVPITVSDFDGLLTAQFSMVWEDTILQYASIENIDSLSQAGLNFGETHTGSGILTFSWDSLHATSLADDQALFAIRFNVIGQPCAISPIVFSDTLVGTIEVGDGNLCEAVVNTVNGSVTIQSSLGNMISANPGQVVSPAAVCVNDPVSALTAVALGELTWYAGDKTTVLGTGSPFTPAVDMTMPGEHIFYVSAQEGVCQSSEMIADTITISNGLSAAVTIDVNQTFPVCPGEQVIFTARPENGGATPAYQWMIDGLAVSGETGQNFTLSSAIADTLIVKVLMTSALSCANPKPVESADTSAIFSGDVTPFVRVVASDTSVCVGGEITFSIDSIGGEGGSPVYQWQVNGIDVNGANNPVFTTSQLNDRDTVALVVTSSASCRLQDQALSNRIGIEVNDVIIAAVDITNIDYPVCSGDAVTLIATPQNGGADPQFRWFNRGVDLLVDNDTLVLNNLSDQDSIWAVMMVTNAPSCLQNNPVASDTVVIDMPGSVTTSVSISGPASVCFGDPALFLVHDSVGGSDPSFEWFVNGYPAMVNGASFLMPADSSAGNYRVTVRMTAGGLGTSCLTTTDAVSNPVDLQIKSINDPDCEIPEMWVDNPRVDPTSCPTIADGTVRFQIIGGSGTFRYKLDNSAWINLNRWNARINSVSYGNHRLFVEDIVGGFNDSIQVFVGSSFGLAATPVVNNPGCEGGDGSFSLQLSGGSGVYNIEVRDESGALAADSLDAGLQVAFNNLDAGIYTIHVSDTAQGGCTTSFSVTLNTPANCDNPCYFTVQAEPVAETCHPALDYNGKVIFHVSPRGAYDFVLMNEQDTLRQNDSTFVNLQAGDYKFRVINLGAGCANSYDSGSVSVPLRRSTLSASATVISNVACFGESTGQAQLNVSAGGAAPYYYSLDHGTSWNSFNSGDVINDLPPNDSGPYNILVSDDPATDACPAEVEVNIVNMTEPIAASFTSIDATCNAHDGSFTINNITGGLPDYIVEFEGRNYNFVSGNPLPFENLSGGDKIFTVVDAIAGGCRKDFQVSINAPGLVNLNPIAKTEATCEGNGEDAQISFSVDLSRSPLSAQYWYGVAPLGVPIQDVTLNSFSAMQTKTVKNLSYGDYQLVVAVAPDGCRNAVEFDISSGPAKIDFNIVDVQDKICQANSGYLELGEFKGRTDSTYYIKIYDYDNRLAHSGTYHHPQPRFKLDTLNEKLQPGDYYIIVTQRQGDCIMEADSFFTIKSVASPEVVIKEAAPSWEDVDQGSLLVRINSPKNNIYSASIDQATWSPVKPVIGPEGGYEISFDNLPYGDYRIWVKDENQGDKCIIRLDTAVARNMQLWIPNIFTPNSDGYNDTFYIRNLPDGAQLTIKNRWGRIVYLNESYRNDWRGNDLAEGLYYYQLTINNSTTSGWIELFRGAGPDLR